jgi:hypothetical protein
MKLWTEGNLPPLSNGDLLPSCSCLGQQSDLVRYEVLLREGGVYVDTDMECVRNIETLIQYGEFFALRRDPRFRTREAFSNAMFGATKGNPIMAEVVGNLRQSFRPGWTDIGPPFFSSILNRNHGKFIDLPFGISLDFTDKKRSAPTRNQSWVRVINHHSSMWFKPSMAPLKSK